MFKLALKDFKIFLADKRSVVLGFLVPICLITLFAFAFGGMWRDNKQAQATTLLVADDDQQAASIKLINRLDSLKEFEVMTTSIDSAINLVKKGREPAVLIIHQGFSDSLASDKSLPLEFAFDAARETEVAILKGALMGQLMGILGTGNMENKALANFDKAYPMMQASEREIIHQQIKESFSSSTGVGQTNTILKSTSLIPEKKNSPSLIHAVAGTSIMMLLFSVVGMGSSLLEEKEQGTLKRLLFSPLKPDHILIGKMLAVMMVSILQLCVMFVYAWLVFRLDILHHVPALLITIVATSFACASFGVLLASIAKSRQQIQGLSTLIVLVMSCIGGSMVPIFVMPAFLQKMALGSVNYWSVQSFYDIFWRMLPITDSLYLQRIAVLLFIGIVLNTLALVFFRKNILKLAQ